MFSNFNELCVTKLKVIYGNKGCYIFVLYVRPHFFLLVIGIVINQYLWDIQYINYFDDI